MGVAWRMCMDTIRFAVFLQVGLVGFCHCLHAANELELATAVVDGDSAHTEERDELVRHLTLVSGKVPDGSGRLRFVIGRPPEGVDVDAFTACGRRIGDTIYLWGDDRITRRGSTTRRGTLHAVYGFLEECLSVHWVFPGDDGIVFKPRSSVDVPENWEWKYHPLLSATEIRTAGYLAEAKENTPYLPFAMRETADELRRRIADRMVWMHRMRHQTRARPPFGHAFTKWTDRFMETHPEYFAMQEDGSRCRKRSRRNELCVANEAVVDQIIADWKNEGCPKYLNVCPNDTTKYCRCTACRKLDRPLGPDEPFGRHVTDRYVNFWNRIAAKAVALRPDVMLDTYAYAGYREPPRVEKIAYPGHFIIGMVPSQEDDNAAQIAGWKKAGMRQFFLRPNYLCYRGVLPRGYERFFYDNFRMNMREGVFGCDYDAYARGGVTDFETYVLGRVIANPNLSFERIQDEFLSQFGPAREIMRRYFLRVRERGERSRLAAQARSAGEKDRLQDDSQLWQTVVAAHPVAELEKDADVLREAHEVEGLTSVEKRRIARHRFVVSNAIASQRFIAARDAVPRDEYVALACDLIALRTKLKPLLPDAWGRVFRGFPLEVKWWRSIAPEIKKRFPEMNLDD